MKNIKEFLNKEVTVEQILASIVKATFRIFKILGLLFTKLWEWITDELLAASDRLNQKDELEASFAPESTIASRWNRGFLISRNRFLTRKKSYENLLLLGQIGSGKTTRFLVPGILSLIEKNDCFILANDPSKELFQYTSGYAKEKGYKVQTLNFSKAGESFGFNFLLYCDSPSKIKRIADLLVRVTLGKGSGDVFWAIQSSMVLSVFMRLVMTQDIRYRNMVNVSYLVSLFTAGNTDMIDELVAKASLTDSKIALEYSRIIAMGDKTLQSVLASVHSTLAIFDDSEIAKVTSVTQSIDFSKLRKSKGILYIHNSISSQAYINVLNSIFYELLFSEILENIPEKEDLDCFFIYEEFSSLYIPLIPSFLANNRKYQVGNLICLQSISQIEKYREEAKNIPANCVTHLILPGSHPTQYLREIQEISGKYSYTDKDGIKRTRPLVTVDSLRQMSSDQHLILQGNQPMVLARSRYFFKTGKHLKRSRIKPAPLSASISQGKIPLIGKS